MMETGEHFVKYRECDEERSSEAAMGGGARSAPFGMLLNPKNERCAQRTVAHAWPKPTSFVIFILLCLD
jgi:hypothetical protein